MQENELFISVTQFLRKDNIISYELKFEYKQNEIEFFGYYRYSELKILYQSLQTIQSEIPIFPSSYWWKTNKQSHNFLLNRLRELNEFFKAIKQFPLIFNSLIMKNFILEAHRNQLKRTQKIGCYNKQMKEPEITFRTPVCRPQKDPTIEPRQRSLSDEFCLTPRKSNRNQNYQRLVYMNRIGTNVVKGILLRNK